MYLFSYFLQLQPARREDRLLPRLSNRPGPGRSQLHYHAGLAQVDGERARLQRTAPGGTGLRPDDRERAGRAGQMDRRRQGP